MYSAVCGANVMERGRHQTRAGEATPARSCAFHLRLVTHKRCAQKGGGRGGGVLQQLLSTLHTHAKHPGAAADRAAPRARRHFAANIDTEERTGQGGGGVGGLVGGSGSGSGRRTDVSFPPIEPQTPSLSAARKTLGDVAGGGKGKGEFFL